MAKQVLTEENLELLARLENFAQARGRSVLELALGWLATQPFVHTIIVGATTPEQVDQNVKAIEWRLSDEEMAEVNSVAQS